MFHYTHLGTGDKRERRAQDIAVGDWVQSRYAAGWYGTVLELNANGGRATVRQVLNKRGGAMRNPRVVTMHVAWFEKTTPP